LDLLFWWRFGAFWCKLNKYVGEKIKPWHSIICFTGECQQQICCDE